MGTKSQVAEFDEYNVQDRDLSGVPRPQWLDGNMGSTASVEKPLDEQTPCALSRAPQAL